MTNTTDIPIIDISGLEGENETLVHDRFLCAYRDVGFGYIVGHGISDDLREGLFDASRRFHSLPHSQKMAIALNKNHRGFIPINTSTDVNSKLADVKKPNQSESFMMMREDGEDSDAVLRGDYLAGPNQWPELDGFREVLEAYSAAMMGLGRRLMKAAALSLGATWDDVAGDFETPTTWLRLLHYPPTAPDPDGDLFGSAPHTDFGCLTILAQDRVGGLQVMSSDGSWLDAPYIEGAFVVNVGDMLHRMTNGILKSTPHRVINRSGRDRFSCPFFFDPNVRSVVKPWDACVPKGEPPKYDPINFGDFLRAELGAGYEAHKETT